MNLVFWLFVAGDAFLFWLAVSFVFIPIGRAVVKITREISNIIKYEETEEREKKSR